MAKLRVLLATLLTTTLVAALAALAPAPPAGADAILDPTFGTDGIVQQVFPSSPVPHGSVAATLVTPDDRVLILGRANATVPTPSPRAVVVRLTSAGALDTSFGAGGISFLPDAFSRTDDTGAMVHTMALDRFGRVVVIGASSATNGAPRRTVLARLTAAGALDASFSTGGIVRLSADGGLPRGLVIDDGDQIVVLEALAAPTVTRLHPNGSVDTTFGTGGTVSLPPTGQRPTIVPVDLVLLPGSGVAVVGTSQEWQTTPVFVLRNAAAVVRLDALGVVQQVRLHRPGSDATDGTYAHASAMSAAARPDGTVVVGLSSTVVAAVEGGTSLEPNSPWYGAFLVAEPPTESPATIVRVDDQPGSQATFRTLTLDSQGGVAVLFNAYGAPRVAAFTPSLTPDVGLGPSGRLNTPTFGDYNDVAVDLAFDSQRRLVFAGVQRDQCCGNWDFGAARLTTLDAPPSSAPTPPRNVTVTVGSRRATVRWDPPASTGGLPITGYSLEVVDAHGIVPGVWGLSHDTTELVVGSLTDGVEYTFTLRARTASHQGEATTLSKIVPLPISIAAFVDRTTLDLRGVPLSSASRASWIQQITARTKTPFDLVVALRRSADGTTAVDPTARLYRASFNRIPDAPGLTYWIGRKRRGTTLNAMASTFAASSEFRGLYGPSLTPKAFVTQVYRNVLGREPDAGGVTYWANQVASGRRTRGQVMVLISESSENIRRQAPAVDTQVAYLNLLGRMPTPAEQTAALTLLEAKPYTALISHLLQDPRYTQRVTA